MHPSKLASKYDKIAKWWEDQHKDSNYGIPQIKRALSYTSNFRCALDVGCGSGGRIVSLLEKQKFSITGIDVSEQMISLAKKNHSQHQFIHQDICTWQTDQKYDFIVAWDSLFHLPLGQQKPVLKKLCQLLKKEGILIFTFGDAVGEHFDQWHDEIFYYSSIGINENIKLLIDNGLKILHLELDQYPESHVYVIAKRVNK